MTDDATYDLIYATDLVYEPTCFQRCGDAHCCHFDRYRRHGPPAERGWQKLPMLAGEYDYLRERGLLSQYPAPQLETTWLTGRLATYRFDLLVVAAPGRCPCDHPRRPTICRLYPLQPLFEPGVGVVGVETNASFFEEIETLAKTPRACPLTSLSFEQLGLLLHLCGAIARNPRCLFSAMAQALAKRLFRERVTALMAAQRINVFTALGQLTASGEFVERQVMVDGLDELLTRFRACYGDDFTPTEPSAALSNP